MNITEVMPIFKLFSGVQNIVDYMDLMMNSIDMVYGMLKEDADLTNSHLPYLAASIANYRYTQTLRYYTGSSTETSSSTQYTPAGTVISQKITEKDIKERYNHSKSLMMSYLEAVAPLLRDDNFEIVSITG